MFYILSAAPTPHVAAPSSVTAFIPGTDIVVYNRPCKSKGKIRPFIIAKGVITQRPIDGKQFVIGSSQFSANLTASRKEVRIHQLISRDAIIPSINKYYPAETKFEDIFDLRYCFDCMVAETNMLIDETGNDDDFIMEAEEKEEDEGSFTSTKAHLQIGTDQEIQARKEIEGMDMTYLHRDDDRLGLGVEDESDQMGDDED